MFEGIFFLIILDFCGFFTTYQTKIWAFCTITFAPKHQLKYKLYSHKANVFFYLHKKFQKIATNIEIVETCPKSICPLKGQ